jgi:hypothetical protein
LVDVGGLESVGEVGHERAPVQSRWNTGTSGHSSGRPSGCVCMRSFM